jgi:hypothetical protein
MRLLALTALAAATLMAGGPPSRPARATDLPGVWMMVDLTHTVPVDPEDQLFAPYQIFAFDRKGGMKHMTSAKPFTEGQLSLFDSAPQVTRYGVDRNGILALVNPSWEAPLRYQCHLVTKTKDGGDPKSPHEGDLLLVSTDDRGREAWSKLLRKTH